MKNLQLPLKGIWFSMTKSGEKTEDYREMNEYWFIRLVEDAKDVFQYLTGCNWDEYPFEKDGAIKEICENKYINLPFKDFSYNIMTLGYPSKNAVSKFLHYKHEGIEMRTGNPDWGAKEGVVYFVIKHGEKINK